MAAPAFRAAGAAVYASAAHSITLPVPTCSPGDYLLAFFAGDAWVSNTPPAATGWTVIRSSSHAAILGKVATAGDSGNNIVFAAGENNGADYLGATSGVVVAYSNALGVDASAISGSIGGTLPSSASTPTVTTTRANDIVASMWQWTATATHTQTPPSTNRVSARFNSNKWGLAVSDVSQASTGASTPRTDSLDSAGAVWTTATVALYGNQVPNAPTLTAPPDGGTVDVTNAQTFGWTFSDPDPGDSQSKFDLRYSHDGGTTWTMVTATTPNPFTTVAAGTFISGDSYQWQVRTYDQFGEVGPWSASRFFTAATPPAGPTITSPTSGGTVNTSPATVEWSFPAQQAYQVRVVGDISGSPDTGTILFNSGAVTDPDTRSLDVPFTTNGDYVHVQVAVESGGLWSDFADVRVLVSYTPPPAPSLAVTEVDPTGLGLAPSALQVTVTTPSGTPAATYVDLYLSEDGGATSIRVAKNRPINDVWTYYTPTSGVDYSVRAVAVAASGATSDSGWLWGAGGYGEGTYGSGAYGGAA